MSRFGRVPVLLALALGSGIAVARAQQVERPAEATDSAITRGEWVFNGPANCVACHGTDGRGTGLAPDLTDSRWKQGRGTYQDILERVTHGVPRRESSTGKAMPMRGWSPASDDELKAVAAYVWSLSHLGRKAVP